MGDMRRLLAALAVAAVVAGCGSLKEQTSQAAAQPAHELLYIATATGMSVVDASTDSVVATLPTGTLLPDRSRYWTVESGDRTTVRGIDPATGVDQVSFVLEGRWSVPAAYGPAPSGLSANGKWMALVAPPTKINGTGIINRFAVIDLTQRRVDRIVNANGDVGFDALSDDGRNLYLVEHLVPAPRYAVRVASFNGSGLDGILGQIKTAEPEVMNGLYHASVALGGEWFLSLYSNPGRGPFIHALNTTQLYAQCILNMPDVPVALRPAWSMVLDPKHPRLYAVNGAGGVVSEVDTAALKVLRSNIDLAPVASTLATAPLHPAALSADGTRIYAAAAQGLIVIYTGDLSVHSRYLADRLIDSVAVSDDGQRLYVASAGIITKVEAATGKPLATIASAPHALGLLAVGSR
jgi:DNA-binding beta-propeller fold protein YncE